MTEDFRLLLPSAELAGGAAFYFTGEDQLRIRSVNFAAGAVIRVSGRFLQVGNIRPVAFERDADPNDDRTPATFDLKLGEGWLQNLTMVVVNGSANMGITFARADVIRGVGTAATVLATLVAGYVSTTHRQFWPGARSMSSLEGQGNLRSVLGTNPAAGVEISETVPTGARWRFISMGFVLVTDATVINRRPNIVFDDGTTILAGGETPEAQAASATQQYVVGVSSGQLNADLGGQLATISVPPIVLPAGFRIRTLTNSIQAGDNYGAPQLFVEEFLEPAT